MKHLAPIGSYSLSGLGQSAEPLNAQDVRNTVVEPGWTEPWLDAALVVDGIPHEQAGRVPEAVKAQLEAVGSDVDKAVWGGGEGLETIRGKVYVRWKPDKPYNAIDYANVARKLFMLAAGGFPAGSKIIMNRYRIDGVLSDKYVYPDPSRGIPPSAPEAARATSVDELPPPIRQPEDGVTPESAAQSGLGTRGKYVLGIGGGLLALGAGWYWYRSQQ